MNWIVNRNHSFRFLLQAVGATASCFALCWFPLPYVMMSS